MFQQTSVLINALKEWNEEVGDYTTVDLQTLLAMVGHQINADKVLVDNADEQLEALDTRIRELVDKHGIDEDFLVTGLITAITSVLDRQLYGHGEGIIFNESILKHAIENGKQSVANTAEKNLERMKDLSFYLKAENAIDKWNIIAAAKFGRAQRREWEGDRFRENLKTFKVTGIK